MVDLVVVVLVLGGDRRGGCSVGRLLGGRGRRCA